MKVFLRVTGFLVLLLLTISALGYFFWYKPKFNNDKTSYSPAVPRVTNIKVLKKMRFKISGLQAYVKANQYNPTHCFIVDMNIDPGKQRFFVYNLQQDSIELAGLVTHGSGIISSDTLQFSNASGSYCTSLGKYRVGGSYFGKFGLAYKLYGLDKTNDNAFERFVVLHAHSCVPDEEVFPFDICESQGCPTVSPSFLQKLKPYIDNSPRPILLCIYK